MRNIAIKWYKNERSDCALPGLAGRNVEQGEWSGYRLGTLVASVHGARGHWEVVARLDDGMLVNRAFRTLCAARTWACRHAAQRPFIAARLAAA